jgi:membrane protein required for colicin V production
MDGITITDIVAGVVLLISVLLAFGRGFAKEVLSLLGWVGAVLLAVFLFPYVEPYAMDWIGNKWLARIAAGVGLFIVAMVVLTIISNVVSDRIQDSSLSSVDRALGVLFGAARAWILLAVIFIGISVFYEKEEHIPADIRTAKSTPVIKYGANLIWSLLPARLREQTGEAAKSVKGATKESVTKKGVESLFDTDKSKQKSDKVFEKLIAPSPDKKQEEKESGGYKDKDRKRLDDLMERTVQ